MRTVALALAFALIASLSPNRAAAERLRVLSYNVHGTAFVLSGFGFPRSRMRDIGEKLRDFDVAALQEDFAYHDTLTEAFAARQIQRGRGPVFRWGHVAAAPIWLPFLLVFNVGVWPLFNGDGLSTIVANPDLDVRRIARERYARCAGYLAGSNDCFAAKGLLAVRVALRNGATVDVYNTHLDAGRERHEDQIVRVSQLEHLRRVIEARSAGHAVIVMGDLNFDATSPSSFAPVRQFLSALDLTDSRVWETTDARWRRKLDHILYRDGIATRLGVPRVGEEIRFRSAAGEPLSDHPAISAAFDVEKSTPGDTDPEPARSPRD